MCMIHFRTLFQNNQKRNKKMRFEKALMKDSQAPELRRWLNKPNTFKMTKASINLGENTLHNLWWLPKMVLICGVHQSKALSPTLCIRTSITTVMKRLSWIAHVSKLLHHLWNSFHQGKEVHKVKLKLFKTAALNLRDLKKVDIILLEASQMIKTQIRD